MLIRSVALILTKQVWLTLAPVAWKVRVLAPPASRNWSPPAAAGTVGRNA